MLAPSRLSWRVSYRVSRRFHSTARDGIKDAAKENLSKELDSALNLSRKISNVENVSFDEGLPYEPTYRPYKPINAIPLVKKGQTHKYTKEIDKLVDSQLNDTVGKRNQALLKAVDGIIKKKKFKKPPKYSFSLSPNNVGFDTIPAPTNATTKPPRLAHELDRVLFQPMNFHPLQDSRTGTYSFNPWLKNIIKVNHFDFDAIANFVSPSRDVTLLGLAQQHQKKYYSSTSSMTGILSHLHLLLSNFRKANLSLISKNFPQYSAELTRGAQLPGVVIMKRMKNGKCVFSIESDKSTDRGIILSVLGHALETTLTTEPDLFERIYDKSSSSYKSPAGTDHSDSYHYSKISDFILRSQLDAHHPELPGTGVFDLKTRAVAAIRHDIAYVEQNDNHTGYEIQKTYGKFESFEREFFELIRSTLLKYSLQARIGRMDGIFVAYHNISKMFGFQYLPLEEIDHILHSSNDSKFQSVLDERKASFTAIYGEESYIMNHDRTNFERQIASRVADAEFKMSMSLLSQVLKQAEDSLPEHFDACRLVFKCESKVVTTGNGGSVKVPVLTVIGAQLNEQQVDVFQNNGLHKLCFKSKESMSDYVERTRILNLETTHNLFGFEVLLNHEVNHHPQSIVAPKFVSKKSSFLDEPTKKFAKETVTRNYYETINKWKHVNFFHPLDVERWKINVQVHQIYKKDKLKRKYLKYLEEKLTALEGQSLAKVEPREDKEIISKRIHTFMGGIEKSSKEKERKQELNSEVTQLQSTLRAYSKKGDLRSSLKSKVT